MGRSRPPAYTQELTDPVGAHRLVGGAPRRVVDLVGRFIAEVRTPPGFFLLEMGDDHALGLHVDELHRESVRIYRLIR